MIYTPRPYQRLIEHFGLNNRRGNIFASPGMGKTSAAYSIFDAKRMMGDAHRALVLAPKRVALSAWPRERDKWAESFGHLKVAAAIGTPDQRLAALRSNPDILSINYDNIEWLVDQYGDNWPFDTVFADECFVAGTPIATDRGSVPIEFITENDKVFTRKGLRNVVRTFRKQTKSLVKIQLVNGTRIICTPSHLFWTKAGWKKAKELGRSSIVYSRLRDLQNAILDTEGASHERRVGSFLFDFVQIENNNLSDSRTIKSEVHICSEKSHCHQRVMEYRGSYAGINPGEAESRTSRSRLDTGGGKGWERQRYEPCGSYGCGNVGEWLGMELSNQDERFHSVKHSDLLQTGLCMDRPDDLLRDRRNFAQSHQSANIGFEKNGSLDPIRVESVSSIQCGNQVDVYDLQVEGIPEYFAGGVLVHNCTRLKGLRVSLQVSKSGKEYINGQGSSRAKAIAEVAHKKVRNWYNMTGSPAPNGVVDVWGQQWFIDGGRRLGNSFTAFSQRWFRAVPGSDGYSNIEPLPHAQPEIQQLLAETSIVVEAKDWFPLEKVIEREVLIDLPPTARRQYREMEKEFYTEVENHEIEVFAAGSKSQKCLQIASGTVIHDTDARAWVKVHDEKLDALRSIVEETNGEPLLVAYQFKADLERILKAFPKARYLDANPKTEDDWNAGKIPILVCHPASAGHGLSLQHGGRILVDYSSGWNLEYDEQVIERLGPTRQYQSGYNRSVFRYRIVARDTIEEKMVLPRLRFKMSVQDAIKNAMKQRL
jgi:hypothetical protein